MMKTISRDTLKRLSPLYSISFDTALQHYPEDDYRFNTENWKSHLKLALLLSKHVYIPDNVVCDNIGMVETFLSGDPPVLAGDFDEYPALIFGIRPGASSLIEALDLMLSKGMSFSLFRRVNPKLHDDIIELAREGRPLKSEDLFRRLSGTSLVMYEGYIKNLDSLLREKGVWRAVHRPLNFKNMVLERLSEYRKILSRNSRHKEAVVIDDIYKKIDEIPDDSKHTRSVYWMILDEISRNRLGGRGSRYDDPLIREITYLVVDDSYNRNIVSTNGLAILSYDDSPYRRSAITVAKLIKSVLKKLGISFDQKSDKRGELFSIHKMVQEIGKELPSFLNLIPFRCIHTVRSDGEFRKSINDLYEKISKTFNSNVEGIVRIRANSLENHLKSVSLILLDTCPQLRESLGYKKPEDTILHKLSIILRLYSSFSLGIILGETLAEAEDLLEFWQLLTSVSPNLPHTNLFLSMVSEVPLLVQLLPLAIDAALFLFDEINRYRFTKYLLAFPYSMSIEFSTP